VGPLPPRASRLGVIEAELAPLLVADDALEASLLLTDTWVTDRMRPDRAIDALDEACAHAQARVVHGPRTIALLEERRALLNTREPATVGAGARASESRPGGDSPTTPDGEEDPLKRMARDGIAAIERFGAGIESLFATEAPPTSPIPKTGPRPRPAQRPADEGPLPPRASRLGVIEAELAPLLVAEGAVVRGVDVARVVGRAVGTTVRWP
jgi:ATP-dependent Clp protease ATP-binding subunit ClpA